MSTRNNRCWRTVRAKHPHVNNLPQLGNGDGRDSFKAIESNQPSSHQTSASILSILENVMAQSHVPNNNLDEFGNPNPSNPQLFRHYAQLSNHQAPDEQRQYNQASRVTENIIIMKPTAPPKAHNIFRNVVDRVNHIYHRELLDPNDRDHDDLDPLQKLAIFGSDCPSKIGLSLHFDGCPPSGVFRTTDDLILVRTVATEMHSNVSVDVDYEAHLGEAGIPSSNGTKEWIAHGAGSRDNALWSAKLSKCFRGSQYTTGPGEAGRIPHGVRNDGSAVLVGHKVVIHNRNLGLVGILIIDWPFRNVGAAQRATEYLQKYGIDINAGFSDEEAQQVVGRCDKILSPAPNNPHGPVLTSTVNSIPKCSCGMIASTFVPKSKECNPFVNELNLCVLCAADYARKHQSNPFAVMPVSNPCRNLCGQSTTANNTMCSTCRDHLTCQRCDSGGTVVHPGVQICKICFEQLTCTEKGPDGSPICSDKCHAASRSLKRCKKHYLEYQAQGHQKTKSKLKREREALGTEMEGGRKKAERTTEGEKRALIKAVLAQWARNGGVKPKNLKWDEIKNSSPEINSGRGDSCLRSILNKLLEKKGVVALKPLRQTMDPAKVVELYRSLLTADELEQFNQAHDAAAGI